MKIKIFILAVVSAFMLLSCGSTVSGPVGRRTEALDQSSWESSVWISAADAQVVTEYVPDERWLAADGASWFVTTLKNDRKVVSAKWMTAGLGVYDIYVNGSIVGEEFLKPGFTHNEKTKYSFTYDITDAFNSASGAENVLAAQVTPGWWADKIVTPGGRYGMVGKKCAFRSVVELTYEDGTVELVGTDPQTWKAGIAGPVTHSAIFDGEYYDARILPGYEAEVVQKLGTPEVNTEFKGEIFPSAGAEIYLRHDLTLDPVRTYVWNGISGAKDGEYGKVVISAEYAAGDEIVLEPGETLVVDFGQNAAAVPSFTFKAAEGTVLTCLPSEILNDGNGAESRGMDGPEGSVHRKSLRAHEEPAILLQYTFGDSKDYVTYNPTRTFYGYRFISVSATDKVCLKDIKSIPVTSITQDMETGRISTGNELINRLISNAVWGMRSNYLSVPTDCPQRDERLGWTADTQVFTETGTFFADTDRFMHKWMRDMRDSQSKLGGFPGVAPFAQYGNETMRLGWADAGVIVPWTIWKQFGDTSIIEENWGAMERFMNHINETKYDHDAHIEENGNYQWADWLSYEPLESCGGGAFHHDAKGRWVPRPEAVVYWDYLSASYWIIDAGMMRDMAAATGRDVAKYEKMVNEAKAYVRKEFMKPDGTFKLDILNTMQTPALFALKNKLVEGKAKENMTARLRENFKQHGNCLQTGFLGTSILMNTLTENGMSDIAYELLFQRRNPSWLYSVDNGATTIWERWNSYMIEKGMGPNGMNSFNHYAYGCVCEWLWETVAGISCDASAPGFSRIIMKPVPDRRLGHLDAEYKSAAGLIKSSWKYEGDKWIWNFTVPEGAVAAVTLPGETQSKEYPSGTYEITK